MPTLSQLKKQAKELGFVDRVRALGFELGPDYFWFYRRRGEYLDVIDFWLKSSREWVKVPVICFVDEIVDHCDMSQFPKGFIKNISSPTDLFIEEDGLELVGAAMEMSCDSQIEKTFSHIAETIENEVDAWFKNITTKEALFNSLSPRFREDDSGEEYRRLLGL